MLGRQNKNLVVRFITTKDKSVYHVIVTRKRSNPQSSKYKIGVVYKKDRVLSVIKLDLKKLHYLLMSAKITFSCSVFKLFNIETGNKK